MLAGFSLERQDCSASVKHDLLYHCKKPQPMLLPTIFPSWEHPGLSSSHPQHHKHPQQAYRLFLFWCVPSRMLVLGWEPSPVCAVIQVAGGEGNHAPHSFCWSSLGCSSLSFFHFTPLVSYFIPSQNSLFPLQAVNRMHVTTSPPHALHFPPFWLWPSWYWSGTRWWSCSPSRLAELEAFVERCLHIH